ncbi:uncharacterized protein LOC115821461 [Chanos chanos]|uniref:Uncharacterized protein LOC115821461 n=1 Tax=Chanos chanos TaxID=29144 RepID=A0A6J2WB79_CHACN|nr:uncharacterized protein LOC115821461 [Chanos chanos]
MAEIVEILIKTVSNHPELYNVTLQDYRNPEKRVNAWQSISASVGLPAVECKTKWKSLRDRYMRERRLEKLKRKKGERSSSYWRHRDTMSFLEPFVKEKQKAGDSGVTEDTEDIFGGVNETSPASRAKVKDTGPKVNEMPQLAFVTQLAPVQQVPQVTQLAIVTKLPPGSRVPQTPGTPPAPNQVQTKCEEAPVLTPQALQTNDSMSALCGFKSEDKKGIVREELRLLERPHDEDELFLLSFVPALKRLSPQKRCAAKIKIQQIMYDVEFNEGLKLRQQQEQRAYEQEMQRMQLPMSAFSNPACDLSDECTPDVADRDTPPGTGGEPKQEGADTGDGSDAPKKEADSSDA